MNRAPVRDQTLTRPLYTLSEAAAVLAVRPTTLHGWARGRTFKGVDGRQHTSEALITTCGVGRGPVVPFVGLGEAYVLAAFRAAGVPMQRIRPALVRLEQEFGVAAALTSDRLKTDGAEVLWEYKRSGGDAEVVDDLVVVRNQQIVFREVVADYLRTITYRNGRVAIIGLSRFSTPVVVDPLRNFGQPTIARRGVRVADVLGRLDGGEPAAEVAADYGLGLDEVAGLRAS